MSVSSPSDKAAAENVLTGALKSVFALSEAYPQLRAAENFGQLQGTLADIEEQIQNARRYYNAVVRDLNTKLAQFPGNLIAGPFGFKRRDFFEIAEAERAVPKVSF
jgi:LemA protein